MRRYGAYARAQGFLDLEGELPPILVSLVIKVCLASEGAVAKGP